MKETPATIQLAGEVFLGSGSGGGSNAKRLLANGCSPLALRPYDGGDGHDYIDKWDADKQEFTPQRIVCNDATLMQDEWKAIDTSVVEIAGPRMKIWSDLMAAGLRYSLPNALGYSILQYQNVGDVGPAGLDMEGLAVTLRDKELGETGSLPLPIVHKEWSYTLRELEMSRNGSRPLDLTKVRYATKKCAELIEMLVAGVYGQFNFGGGNIWGLTNFPDRLIGNLSDPNVAGWTGADFVTDLLAMRSALYASHHYGPYRVYVGPGWDAFLDEDASAAKGDDTLRQRGERTPNISGIVTADYLPMYDIVMVEMDTDTIRGVVGMPLMPVTWETMGGWVLSGRVMGILVPNLRSDYNGQSGIAHYTI